ncbi:membrane protein insertion efficiency factor YidD [Cellulomonas sp. NPDC089187]|uniref:membrane protein insertion efficiency factor YidD n=1 Tax=Cellulomonas sp. NPDC089187 TaxID=3154970 RepID=UPI003415B03D
MNTVLRAPRRLLIWLVRGYQRFISPMTPPTCRFYPSCSSYAVTAIERHGVIRGGAMAVWRLLRCNPWNPGGVDDVPPVGHRHPHDAAPAAH